MLNVKWARSTAIKRTLALAVLAYFSYVGYMRCLVIVHADRCLDSGGHYQPSSDTCRH